MMQILRKRLRFYGYDKIPNLPSRPEKQLPEGILQTARGKISKDIAEFCGFFTKRRILFEKPESI